MKQKIVWLLLLGLVSTVTGHCSEANLVQSIEIPYKKFVLKNGLTLLVHEDHKAPIVAVNVWYHVGSKNERPGRTGFAHLFEHLMFNGSEHFNDDYFQAMERIGATDLNGTTNPDRTNYFENAPKSALDLILWLESDRMGHLLGAISQAKLDEQRGVVQNEKRQGENQPYGRARELLARGTYPAGHPYSWTTIGSMDDLNAASLEDVQNWFKTYYGAANAVLVIAGDIDPETAREKVEKYFGDIPPGPPVARPESWVAKRTGTHRERMDDRVPQARIYKIWNIPEHASPVADYLNLASDILAQGKNSRLHRRLVYQDQIASSVSAYVDLREISGQFAIVATARPGQSLESVEKAVDEELAKFLKEGPAADEMNRVKTEFTANFIRGIERIGGFGGKSDILAMNEVLAGSADHYKAVLDRVEKATAHDVQKAAQQWLSDGEYDLEVHPFPAYTTSRSSADRSKLPEAGQPPDAKFPELQRAALSNGLKIILAERHSVPLVLVKLVVNAGFASDQFTRPGTAAFAMDLLDEGTKRRGALEISRQLALLGAELATGSDLDSSSVTLSAVKGKVDASLDIFADVILAPTFPDEEFKRIQKQQLDLIRREKSQPVQMALRVLPQFLFGPKHAYGIPFTGSGTEEAVSQMTLLDARKFHERWFKPNNAVLVVVGDMTLHEIQPKLERLFGSWKAGDVPQKNISHVEQPQAKIYLLDRPGAIQSVIFAGHLAPPTANPKEPALQTFNAILGGTFTSRLNMNLREDKHWSYGAHSMFYAALGQRPFLAYAPVQTDKTVEAFREMAKELTQIAEAKPPTPAEVEKAKKNETQRLAGAWETNRAVSNSIAEMVRHGLPEDYFQTLTERFRAVDVEQVSAAGKELLAPERFVWVVVGDLSKIEAGLRDLKIGPVEVITP